MQNEKSKDCIVNNVYIIYKLYGREVSNEDSQCDVYEYHHIMHVRKYIYVTTQAERKIV